MGVDLDHGAVVVCCEVNPVELMLAAIVFGTLFGAAVIGADWGRG